MRRFTMLACVVVALVAVPPAWATHDPTNCSDVPSTVLLETQAWWNPMPGPVTHPGTGKTGHVHLSTCFPLNGMLPDPTNPALGSPLKLGVRVQLHNHPGKLVTVRWSDGSAIKEQIPDSLTCATEQCEKQYLLTLDASKFDYSGWREVRFTADTRNTDGTRFFNTTRWCVFVTNGKSRQDYCGGNVPQRCATAGWYTNLDYVNTYYDCLADPPGSTVSGTWCFRARFERAYGFASVDPAYHATPAVNEGTVIYNGVGGNVWRDLCLDTRTIANGPHRLFLRSDALGSQPKGKGSGVFTLPFNVANAPPGAPTADFSGTPTSGTAPLSVTFTDQSTGAPTSWAWDFDNNGTVDSNDQKPTFTYNNSGTYTVRLTATNASGSNTATKTGYITVTSSTPGGTLPPITPAADAQVKSTSAGTNYGTLTTLQLREGDPTTPAIYHIYLRFAVSGLTARPSAAKLRLWVTDPSDVGGSVFAVSNTWTEGAITWNNAPAISGTALSRAGAVATGTWAEFDVTAGVTGNGDVSFGLTTTSSNSAIYASREDAAHQPQLVLTR